MQNFNISELVYWHHKQMNWTALTHPLWGLWLAFLAQSSVASIVNKTTRSKSFLAPPFFFLSSLLSQLICMLIYRDAYGDPFLAPLHNISRVSVEKWMNWAKRIKLGVSWCCGNYCLLAFVLWCGYCSVSFQSFVLRHWCPQHQETTIKLVPAFFIAFPNKAYIYQRSPYSIISHSFKYSPAARHLRTTNN